MPSSSPNSTFNNSSILHLWMVIISIPKWKVRDWRLCRLMQGTGFQKVWRGTQAERFHRICLVTIKLIKHTGVITVYIYRLGVVQQVLSDKSHPGWVSDRGERLGVRGGGWGRSTSLRAVISKFTLKLRWKMQVFAWLEWGLMVSFCVKLDASFVVMGIYNAAHTVPR